MDMHSMADLINASKVLLRIYTIFHMRECVQMRKKLRIVKKGGEGVGSGVES